MEQAKKDRAIGRWLLLGVFLILILIMLGGITRLTGSGLSITEWKPIMGAIPPLNEKDWNEAFEGYKKIGQYRYLNSDFTLSDFKSIFFWEWFHRFWARVVLAGVFVVGFTYFLIKKYLDKKMITPFVVLFILGGIQGKVGWEMVKSGLNPEDLYVGHIELATHLTMALILLTYTLWFALKLLVPQEQRYTNSKLHYFTLVIIAVLFIQLPYGAFMAGLKAAANAPTWPSINGDYLPATLANKSWVSDPINVHFMHRQLAYLLCTLIFFWFGNSVYKAKHATAMFRHTYKWPFILVILQLVLGITTVLTVEHSIPDTFGKFQLIAELHQMVAMLLLISLVVNLYVVKRKA